MDAGGERRGEEDGCAGWDLFSFFSFLPITPALLLLAEDRELANNAPDPEALGKKRTQGGIGFRRSTQVTCG